MPSICCGVAQAVTRINNVNTNSAMHAPGTGVTIYVDLENTSAASFSGSVGITMSHLGAVVETLPDQSLLLAAGQATTLEFSWNSPTTDFRGYLAQVSLRDAQGAMIARGSSAVDVSSHWRRFPRYGYISRYDPSVDSWNAVWQLKNHHINGLQFYDWKWKHHWPTPPSGSPLWPEWPDVAFRATSRNKLTDATSAANYYNMVSVAYNDLAAAYDDCYTDGSGVTLSMGRFPQDPAVPITAENQLVWGMPTGWATLRLRLMNVRDPGWQNYIFGRMNEAINTLGFDGWHMDNLVTDQTVRDAAGNIYSVSDHYADFINNAKVALGGKSIIFNNLDGIGISQVSRNSNPDFIYAELWGAYPYYNSILQAVESTRRLTSKPIVFAAYINRGKPASGFFNEPGVRLANAAIFANGASHIELGDGSNMLHTEYFPDSSIQMNDSLRAATRTYYDFLTAYQNLLRDETVGTTNRVRFSGSNVPRSSDGTAGTVWAITKRRPGAAILHLVNLRGIPAAANSTLADWRDTYGTYPTPTQTNNLPVRLYYNGSIGGGKLWSASPDRDHGVATELSYSTGSDGNGNYIQTTVPQLQYWEMIWLEMKGTTNPATTIQAENFVSWSGINTEITTDIGGGSNVGFVSDANGESYTVYENVAFSYGATSIQARVASIIANTYIEFRLNASDGPLIATVPVGNTGGWQNWQTVTAPVSGVLGTHRLYAVFKNGESNLNHFQFTMSPATPELTWREGKFGASWEDSAIAGNLADPDHDGLVNLIERAYNGNPNMAAPDEVCQTSTAAGRLVLNFSRDTTQNDLTLAVQSADTPTGPWTDLARSTAGAPFVSLALGAGISESGSGLIRTVQFTDAVIMNSSAQPRRFLRLRASY